jgi:hypothetical protein
MSMTVTGSGKTELLCGSCVQHYRNKMADMSAAGHGKILIIGHEIHSDFIDSCIVSNDIEVPCELFMEDIRRNTTLSQRGRGECL